MYLEDDEVRQILDEDTVNVVIAFKVGEEVKYVSMRMERAAFEADGDRLIGTMMTRRVREVRDVS